MTNFKSVCVPGLELNISPSPQGIAVTPSIDGVQLLGQGITLSLEDTASVMLAIAEAAEVVATDPASKQVRFDMAEHLGQIAFELRRYAEWEAKRTAEAEAQAKLEAEAQAKLEAEALELFKASGVYGSDRILLKFSDLDDHIQKAWLAVARRAREINKEATK